MKFKQQEEEKVKSSSFYDEIKDLLCLNAEFDYAIRSLYTEDLSSRFNYHLSNYIDELGNEFDLLLKLAISLDSDHKHPVLEIVKKPADNDTDLFKFEEKYYNMIKEIGNNALKESNFEVISHLSKIIVGFKHYFCTIVHESDIPGETSS
jgi:hypothetical protein